MEFILPVVYLYYNTVIVVHIMMQTDDSPANAGVWRNQVSGNFIS